MSATVVHAPNQWNSDPDRVTVFLGGTIDMGNSEDWQAKFTEALKDLPVTILNPRRLEGFKPEHLEEQITWELKAQREADVLVYVFLPGSASPVTMLEVGAFGTSYPDTIVCCPDDFYRARNVQRTCDAFNTAWVRTMDETIANVRALIAKRAHLDAKRVKTEGEKEATEKST